MGLRTGDWAHVLLLPLLLSAGALTAAAATADLTLSGDSSTTGSVGITQPAMGLASAGMPAMDGMEGMDHGDHGGAATPDSTPTPRSTVMPGMPGRDGGGADTGPNGHGKAGEPASDRPLAPVLATFGAGNALVLLAAGLLRRRDSTARAAKASQRGGKAHS